MWSTGVFRYAHPCGTSTWCGPDYFPGTVASRVRRPLSFGRPAFLSCCPRLQAQRSLPLLEGNLQGAACSPFRRFLLSDATCCQVTSLAVNWRHLTPSRRAGPAIWSRAGAQGWVTCRGWCAEWRVAADHESAWRCANTRLGVIPNGYPPPHSLWCRARPESGMSWDPGQSPG